MLAKITERKNTESGRMLVLERKKKHVFMEKM